VESDYIRKMERNSLISAKLRQTISISIITAALMISSISVLSPHVLAQTSPVGSVNMTSGNPTVANNSTIKAMAELGNKKTFYMISQELDGVNETKLGIPGDVYSPSTLAVNRGDTVTIHFYNIDASDHHTFTMGTPYNIDKDVGPLENTTIAFKASDPGVYKFFCTHHPPTMAGQLIVLPPPTIEESTSANSFLLK
jgi:plastocyanin